MCLCMSDPHFTTPTFYGWLTWIFKPGKQVKDSIVRFKGLRSRASQEPVRNNGGVGSGVDLTDCLFIVKNVLISNREYFRN